MHFTRVDQAYMEVHNIPMVMSFLWQGLANINDLLLLKHQLSSPFLM